MKTKESKPCQYCQRLFTNRKSWRMRGQWEEVRFCSDRCRRSVTAVEKR